LEGWTAEEMMTGLRAADDLLSRQEQDHLFAAAAPEELPSGRPALRLARPESQQVPWLSFAGHRLRWVCAALLLPLLLLLTPRVRQVIDDWLTPPPVRLAVVPFQGEREVRPLASGVLQDVSNRLADSGGKLLVIPVTDIERENVRTLEQVKSMFNATHVLRG